MDWLGMTFGFLFFWWIAYAALYQVHKSWKHYLAMKKLQPLVANEFFGINLFHLWLRLNKGEEALTKRDIIWITLILGGIGIAAFLAPLIGIYNAWRRVRGLPPIVPW